MMLSNIFVKLKMTQFYHCFTPLNHQSNKDTIKIEINQNFKSLIEIFDYFGKVLYQDAPEKNIIIGGTYFGKNTDAFYDCLTNYFFEVNEYAIHVYISNIPKEIDYKRFYAFMMILIAVRKEFPNFNLNVFISKEVFDFYFNISFELMQLHLLEPSPFE